MKAIKKLDKVRRKAWLATVAAYSAGVDSATDKFDQIYVDGNAFVNSLVDRGASLEAELQLKLGARAMLDEKIAALRAKLGMNKESREQQLDTLSAKLDDLIDVVAKLAQKHAAQQSASQNNTTAAAPAASKAPATRKPAAAKTSAQSKAASAKPAAAKRTTTKSASTPAKTTTAAKSGTDTTSQSE